jgi:hypothetical protein
MDYGPNGGWKPKRGPDVKTVVLAGGLSFGRQTQVDDDDVMAGNHTVQPGDLGMDEAEDGFSAVSGGGVRSNYLDASFMSDCGAHQAWQRCALPRPYIGDAQHCASGAASQVRGEPYPVTTGPTSTIRA